MARTQLRRKDRILVTIAKTLGTGVFICTILLLIPLSLPRLLGYKTFNVVSGSMEPEIPVGSLILVKDVDPLKLEEEDIIAFYSNDIPVCHRVVENNTFSEKLMTKGDANNTEDFNLVDYADVIGIVEHHYPIMGIVGQYFSSMSGKLVIIEVLVVGLLLNIIADRIAS